MQKVIAQLQAEGYPVQDEDLPHLSPACFEYYSRLGKYSFAEQEYLLRKSQANEGFAHAHGHGNSGQAMGLDDSQNVVLQGLFFCLGRRGSYRVRSAHKQGREQDQACPGWLTGNNGVVGTLRLMYRIQPLNSFA